MYLYIGRGWLKFQVDVAKSFSYDCHVNYFSEKTSSLEHQGLPYLELEYESCGRGIILENINRVDNANTFIRYMHIIQITSPWFSVLCKIQVLIEIICNGDSI